MKTLVITSKDIKKRSDYGSDYKRRGRRYENTRN